MGHLRSDVLCRHQIDAWLRVTDVTGNVVWWSSSSLSSLHCIQASDKGVEGEINNNPLRDWSFWLRGNYLMVIRVSAGFPYIWPIHAR
jgi:hypothetical protein